MATSAANKKIVTLYGKLGEKERVRMLAKLSREHNIVEMEKLRNATPPEHADAYNHALKLLRVLNGNALDWISLSRLGMERDRLRFQAFIREAAFNTHLGYQYSKLWRLIPYPVTESEYRAIRTMKRGELVALSDYATMMVESAGDFDNLNPAIGDYLDNPPDDDELTTETLSLGIRAIIDDAIKKGDLPKSKRKDGEFCLPDGVLTDWGEGTTEETYNLGGPGFNVPMLRLLHGEWDASWDIHPDSEANTVKERRHAILTHFPVLPGAPEEPKASIKNLHPPLTKKELEQSEELEKALSDTWNRTEPLAELAYDAALSHAEHRAQLAGIHEAIDTIQRDDFHGEDPLFPEIRVHLESAQEEAERFPTLWEDANSIGLGLYRSLYKLQGFEPPKISPLVSLEELQKPAPMPTKEPLTEEMLQLIRGWGE